MADRSPHKEARRNSVKDAIAKITGQHPAPGTGDRDETSGEGARRKAS